MTAPVTIAEPHVMTTYGRLPIALVRGRGCRVWDSAGREYLDGLGGIAVNTLGHAHPKFVAALQEQVATLIHCSNYYHVPGQEQLAAKLVELSGLSNAFFCSTGLEANEAALKLARKFGHDKGIERPEIIVFEKAFHGRSIATLSATGNPKVQAGFGPLVEGFVRVPLNDIAALQAAVEAHPNVVAVFFETIQGEGGINPARWDYLRAVRALCDARDLLLMLDEVQCGIGRTGKWFAHQWAGITPDVMPLAKGLGSGLRLGHPALQYHRSHRPDVSRHPDYLRPVRAGGHRRTYPGQGGGSQAPGEILRRRAHPRIRRRPGQQEAAGQSR